MIELTPELQLRRLTNAYQLSRAIQVAAELEIGPLLADGPRSVEELATATQTVAPVLSRLLRVLAEIGVVEALPDGTFGATPLSTRLHLVDNIAQGSEAWAAWGALPGALRSGEPSFPEVHGQSFYDYLGTHPRQATHWQESNAEMAASLASDLLEVLPLEGREQVVDVGGGDGTLLAQILQRHRESRGILMDLPAVVATADSPKSPLATAGVLNRCSIVGADAFESIPPEGDVYLLCRVLFNWDDQSALRLLTRCREAMGASAQLLILEALMPEVEPGTPTGLAAADLHHFLLWGGGYRTAGELTRLLREGGFRNPTVHPLEGTFWTVLETHR